mgnify:CR=1 FL=1
MVAVSIPVPKKTEKAGVNITLQRYITASVDYTLQNQGKDASIYLMNEEIENAVKAIKQKTKELGYHIAGMAPCGVSAGGTLAMNLAYNGNSAIPVKFVFQLAALHTLPHLNGHYL